MASQVLWYDFTDFSEDHNKIISMLMEHCADWAFQREQCPTTGSLHFQGRMKLKSKQRLGTLIKNGTFGTFHLSITR